MPLDVFLKLGKNKTKEQTKKAKKAPIASFITGRGYSL